MGTQGSRSGALNRRPGTAVRLRTDGNGFAAYLCLIAASATLLSALGACSSFSSPWSSASNQAPVPPPPAYSSAPPAAAPNYAATPPRSYGATPPPAASPAPVVASAAPPPRDDEITVDPYPKQPLSELFKDSLSPPQPAQSAQPAQNLPRPPTSYTPSAGPYVPNQQAYGAPAGTVQTAGAMPPPQPPPVDATANITAYPQQSLFDVFSGK